MNDCEAMIRVARHIRDAGMKVTDIEHAIDAIDVTACCRASNENDLADAVEKLIDPDLLQKAKEQPERGMRSVVRTDRYIDRNPMRGVGDVVARTIKAATFGAVKPCGGCKQRQALLNQWFPFNAASPSLNWAYGVTTVQSRIDNGLLERTLNSLKAAGFDQPRLFVDGPGDASRFHLPVTQRDTILAYGHWLLTLMELYLRDCHADRYAIFQDDLVTCRNLKKYLNETPYPERGYLNLYTFPHNQPDQLSRRRVNGKMTHANLDPNTIGFYPACQNGMGAVALVFSHEAVRTLLVQPHIVERVKNPERRHEAIDGAVVESFRQIGWTEYVHNPSLVQHTGINSSMGHKKHKLANSFRGEEFDLAELLG